MNTSRYTEGQINTPEPLIEEIVKRVRDAIAATPDEPEGTPV